MSGLYSAPRPIGAAELTTGFDCGEPSLNEYLVRRALANHLNGASRCYVSLGEGRVVGYYTLSAAGVERAATSGRVRRNMPSPVPVVLLGRLAVDLTEQGRGLGAGLLRDAILRTVAAADQIGVRALVVEALNSGARSFYQAHGFEESPTDPLHLMVLIQDAVGNSEPTRRR